MIRVLVVVIALMASGMAVDPAAAADTEGESEAPAEKAGWTPALNMSLNVFNFDGDGAIMSGVGQSTTGTGHVTIGEFRFGVDVSSPEFDLGFTAPRLFVQGGLIIGPEYVRMMAGQGNFITNQPEQSIGAAILDNTTNGTPYPANSTYAGQGSVINAVYRGFGWYASAGAEFDIPGVKDLLRFRPYAVYTGEKMSAAGRLTSVTGVGPNFVIHRQSTAADEDIHYLGPAAELDLILTSSQRLEIILYTGGEFLFNVGDGQILLNGITAMSNVNQQPVVGPPNPVIYTFTTPSFRYNLQFGLRFAWKDMFGK